MLTKPSHWAFFLAVCFLILGCQPKQRVNSDSSDQKPRVIIKSVEIVEQDPSGISTSPKKLEEWTDMGNSKLPVFDVVVHLENVSESSIQDSDFIVLTTMDFVIAPTYLYEGDVRRILREGNWSRLGSVDDVKMATMPFIKSSEIAGLRINGFNLGNLLGEYNGQDHTLWPWGLRVNVHVMDRQMNRVVSGQSSLRIIPADKRISK